MADCPVFHNYRPHIVFKGSTVSCVDGVAVSDFGNDRDGVIKLMDHINTR